MLNINKALKLDKIDDIENEINERHKLINEMVGTLYPQILRDEIILLLERERNLKSC